MLFDKRSGCECCGHGVVSLLRAVREVAFIIGVSLTVAYELSYLSLPRGTRYCLE